MRLLPFAFALAALAAVPAQAQTTYGRGADWRASADTNSRGHANDFIQESFGNPDQVRRPQPQPRPTVRPVPTRR
jgi:hypothetical protein